MYPSFEDRYQLILFDYVGSGQSDLTAYNPERYASLAGYAQDVPDICAELNLEHIIFVGHSVSCLIGMLSRLKQPGLFDQLVMVSPSPYYINKPGYEGSFDEPYIDEHWKPCQLTLWGGPPNWLRPSWAAQIRPPSAMS
jgi:sigma-B regulation protein RsbQ